MLRGRHRHGSSLDLAVRQGKLLDGPECAAAEFARDSIGARYISVNHAHKPYRLALLGKLVVNTGMIAAKGAYANDGNINQSLRGQVRLSLVEWMIKS